MDSVDDLINDLESLSPTQLGETIAFVKQLREPSLPNQQMSIGVVLVDEDGVIAFASNSAERIFGYEPGELHSQKLESILTDVPTEDRLSVSGDLEISARKKQGSEITLQIGWSAIHLGGRRFALASIADLTERKVIDRILRKHEEQRAMIFSEGILGDFTWNIDRDELEAHPTIFKLYGAHPIAGAVPGNWFRSRQHPEDIRRTEEKWLGQLATGDELSVEFRVNGDDGITRWIECRGVAVRDSSGTARQVHGLNIDITARKLAEIERAESEARARRAEELLRAALQYSNTVVWRWNIKEDRTEWSGAVKELFGIDQSVLNGWAAFQHAIVPEDVPALQEAIDRSCSTGSEFRHEFRIARPNGEIRWIAGRAGLLRDHEGFVCGMTGVNFDVTDKKGAEEELKQSERDFRELANVLPQLVFTTDALGNVEYYNQRFDEISLLSSGSHPSFRWAELLSKDDRDRARALWLSFAPSGRPLEMECRLWDRRREQHRWHLARAVPVRNAENAIVRWIGTLTDIHDQKQANDRLESEVQSRTLDLNHSLTLLRQREEQLRNSLHEKEALLREIHHRVKNNLQIVSSLLSMQAANAGDGAAVAALQDSERRISTMAMIHEQLYGTDDMHTVEFAQHASRLAQSLFASMSHSPKIFCRLDVSPVELTIHQAIPCALILNELLTNALKYAYPNGGHGDITVHLSCEEGLVALIVSDKGVGLPSDVSLDLPKTLGLQIVQVLVSQLEGELVIGGPPGASFSIHFRHQRPMPAPAQNSDNIPH